MAFSYLSLNWESPATLVGPAQFTPYLQFLFIFSAQDKQQDYLNDKLTTFSDVSLYGYFLPQIYLSMVPYNTFCFFFARPEAKKKS